MGNMCSSGSAAAEGGDQDAKKKSQAIDRALDEDQRKLRRECKILLLGMTYLSYTTRLIIGYLAITCRNSD